MDTQELDSPACQETSSLLSQSETERLLRGVPDWNLKTYGIQTIYKVFHFNSFKENIAFINEIAKAAESEKHHPGFHVSYKDLTVELTTHSANGLSVKDFLMATRIDNLHKTRRP